MQRPWKIALCSLLLAAAGPAAEAQTAPELTDLIVHVVDDQGRAVPGAEVILRMGDEDSIDRWTNGEGLARYRQLPRGRARVQVLANGFEPSGRHVQLETGEMKVEFQLRRSARPDAEEATPAPPPSPSAPPVRS